MQQSNVFNVLSQINVSDKTRQKGDLNYLSWASAWELVKVHFPNVSFEIKKFDNLPYIYDPATGYMVFTSVTIDGITHEMMLPVMDSKNKTMKAEAYTYQDKYKKQHIVEAATMFDINKAIMRCLTKNLAMHGLGLNLYTNEDLPSLKFSFAESYRSLRQAKSEEELMDLFQYYHSFASKSQQAKLTEKYNELKEKITQTVNHSDLEETLSAITNAETYEKAQQISRNHWENANAQSRKAIKEALDNRTDSPNWIKNNEMA